MPLSEHEQRLLEQIEQALYAEDPKFASTYRNTDLRRHYRNRLYRAGAVVLLGLGLLVGGVVTKLIPVSVAGFVVMVAGFLLGLSAWQRLTGRRNAARGPRPAAAPRPRRSPWQRLQERWQRRWDERGR